MAFSLPKGSSGSPYLPSPICSITHKHDIDSIEQSSKGKANIEPFLKEKIWQLHFYWPNINKSNWYKL